MSFLSPAWLLAVLAVPALLALQALARRRRRRYAVRFPAVATLAAAAAAVPVAAWRRTVPVALALAGVAALAVAMARPVHMVRVPIERASIVLVTDHSGSMQATDVNPTRIAAVRRATQTFLDQVPDPLRVGVVGFSDRADVVQAPTTDRAAAARTLDAQTAQGATATGDALQTALDLLRTTTKTTSGKKPPVAVVLLSDGATTAGTDPLIVAREAARRHVPVYTVALGKQGTILEQPGSFGFGGGQQGIDVSPDPATLSAISRLTHATAFTVDDAERLTSIYKSLGSRLGTKSTEREVTKSFAIAGFVLLLGAGIGSASVRSRWT